MIRKPQGYNEQTAYTGGFEQLPIGGYVCKILGVKTEEKDYGTMLTLMFDFVEADSRVIDKSYRSYFNTIYQGNKLSDPEAKWPAGGLHRLSLPDQISGKREQNMLGFFKGFIEAVKNSNPGFVCGFDTGDTFDEQTLKGKLFGGIFGREQYEANGDLKWATRIVQIRSVDTIKSGEYKMPEDKPLAGGQSGNTSGSAPQQPNMSRFEDLDDDLPF